MATTPIPFGDANSINEFMTNQAVKPFMANLPNYAAMVGQRTQNTGQMLKGQLPNDVISQIAQSAAERGISSGAPGSDNSNAAFLRALGLNSLDMMGMGSKELTQSIADTPVPELWNPASLYVPTVLGQQEQNAASSGVWQQQHPSGNYRSDMGTTYDWFTNATGW